MSKHLVLLCIFIIPLLVLPKDTNFINQRKLNSKAVDRFPIISADGKVLFFSSRRKGHRKWATKKRDSDSWDFDIYFAEKKGDSWRSPKNMGKKTNTPQDDGVMSISQDGQTIYFVSFKNNSKNGNWNDDGGPFYKAELKGNKWENVQGLGGGITDFFTNKDLDDFHVRISGASISPDGHEFYFSTNAKTVYGKFDIWVSFLKNNRWSTPQNLGPIINAKDEDNGTPYIAFDGRTLYFSSTGHGGLGGEDLFFSVKRANGWSKPINLGPTINSPSGESELSIPAGGDAVYLVSSRRGTKGSSDIWRAKLPPEVRPSSVILLHGKILDRKTKKPLEAQIKIDDLSLQKEISTLYSNSKTGKYSLVLQSGRHYGIMISKNDYMLLSDNFDISLISEYSEIEKNYYLTPIEVGAVVVMKNIFFDFNKADVRPESFPILDETAEFLRQNHSIIMEVSGHTDSLGTIAYNQNLSQWRADSVRTALIRLGISEERIKAAGYGESRPIDDNGTEEGRQKNRRTEFKILAK